MCRPAVICVWAEGAMRVYRHCLQLRPGCCRSGTCARFTEYACLLMHEITQPFCNGTAVLCMVMLCVSVQAHNALMLGVTTNAVATAANLLLSAHTHAMFSVAGQLTNDIMLSALLCV